MFCSVVVVQSFSSKHTQAVRQDCPEDGKPYEATLNGNERNERRDTPCTLAASAFRLSLRLTSRYDSSHRTFDMSQQRRYPSLADELLPVPAVSPHGSSDALATVGRRIASVAVISVFLVIVVFMLLNPHEDNSNFRDLRRTFYDVRDRYRISVD